MIAMIMLVVMMVAISGCQLDFCGPSISAKVIRKGENNDQEFLSRGSGMTGGNSYAAGGGRFFSWGNNKDEKKN
jgi:hypothetical protein